MRSTSISMRSRRHLNRRPRRGRVPRGTEALFHRRRTGLDIDPAPPPTVTRGMRFTEWSLLSFAHRLHCPLPGFAIMFNSDFELACCNITVSFGKFRLGLCDFPWGSLFRNCIVDRDLGQPPIGLHNTVDEALGPDNVL